MNRWQRWALLFGTALFVLGAAVIAAGVAWQWWQHAQTINLPPPTGKYNVARTSYDWVDSSRLETLAPTDAPRELMVYVWYPTDAVSGVKADYMLPAWRTAREREYGLWDWLTQDLRAVHTNSFGDAPLSDAQDAFPVVVLMPGLGPVASDYTTLAEELASQGYIVAAPTPSYSASVVVFDDGRVAEGTRAGNVDDDATYAEAHATLDGLIRVWAGDAQFVLDQLTRIQEAEADGRFGGHLDLAQVAIVGHSFGGATAAEVLAHDPRFKAGVNLDGFLYGSAPQTGLKQPFLSIWSEHDDSSWGPAAEDIHALYAKLPHDAYQFTIRGAQHFDFADYAVMDAPVIHLKGGLGSIDGGRGLAITRAYLVAFLDRYLKGMDSELLHGAAIYPEIMFGR